MFEGSDAENAFDGSNLEPPIVMNGYGGNDFLIGAHGVRNVIDGGDDDNLVLGHGVGDHLSGGRGGDLLDGGVARRTGRITVGADKGYDAAEFVMEARELGVTPHVAQNTSGRRSAIDGRTTRHPGYAASQRIRKRIEAVFGWMKAPAGHRKTRFRGLPRVRFAFTLGAAAYNLTRLPKLLAA